MAKGGHNTGQERAQVGRPCGRGLLEISWRNDKTVRTIASSDGSPSQYMWHVRKSHEAKGCLAASRKGHVASRPTLGPLAIPLEGGIENPNFWDQKSELRFAFLGQNFRTRPHRSRQGWAKFPNSNSKFGGVKTPNFTPLTPFFVYLKSM